MSTNYTNGQGLKPRIVEMTAAQAFMHAIAAVGIRDVFDYPGGASLFLNDVLHDFSGINRYRVRHEQQAGHMAEGYNGASGDIAMVLVTSGPGATNVITPVTDAKADSYGMLVVTGQVSSNVIGTNAFQEAPVFNLMMDITKHNSLLMNPENAVDVAKWAVYLARNGRQGPVAIDFPKNVQNMPVKVDLSTLSNLPIIPPRNYHIPNNPDLSRLDDVIEWIQKAERPSLYIGGGVISGNAHEELRQIAKYLGIPVFTTLKGLGAYPANLEDELWMGMTGMHGTVAANHALHKSDLLLVFGARFDDRVTGDVAKFAPEAKIVHVDIDNSEIGKVVDMTGAKRKPAIGINADVRYVLSELIKAAEGGKLKPGEYNEWREYLNNLKKKYPISSDDIPNGISPQYAIATLYEVMRELDVEPIITTGVGQHQMFAAQRFCFSSPRSFITSGGLGTMGFGYPAAAGAQIAKPERVVVDIDGDGSFEMTDTTMGVISDYGLPVKAVIIDDESLGMVRQWQRRFYDERYSGIHNNTPDFAEKARIYGIEGRVIRPEDKHALRQAYKSMLTEDGPFVLQVKCIPSEVYPMIPAGKSLDDMIAGHD